MKKTVTKLMHMTGAFTPFRLVNRDKALIVTYHRFSESALPGTTSAKSFNDQLSYLTTHYRVIPLSELAGYLADKRRLPAGIASITIDDGYNDAYEVAFPLLKQYRVPATLFIVSEFVDRRIWLWTDKLRFIAGRALVDDFRIAVLNIMPHLRLERSSQAETASHVNEELKKLTDDVRERHIFRIAASLGILLPDLPPSEYSPISWEQVGEMSVNGIEIGSHTATHPILTCVDDEQLTTELIESRSRIEEAIARRVDSFCYPNGDYNPHICNAVRNAGYKCAVTTDLGLNRPRTDLYTLKRVHTETNLARFIQCSSGFEQFKTRVAHAARGAAAICV